MRYIPAYSHDTLLPQADTLKKSVSARQFALTICAIGVFFLSTPEANAQDALQPMSDPNALCLNNSQAIGSLTLPLVLEDELQGDPVENRLDFFSFEAAPGTLLEVRMEGQTGGAGTLNDPFLGLFDNQCRLLALNDDFRSLNSFLRFAVPDSGVFTLAAAKYPDSEFNGSSGSSSSGSYRLSLEQAQPLIESISVRITDLITREPVRGDTDPFGFVELYRCNGGDCDQFVAAFNSNSEGRVTFNGTFSGLGLSAGTYLLRAGATDYGSNESGRFIVTGNEAFEVWDITLAPPPIAVGNFSTCEDIPPQGGVCLYEVNINNNTRQDVAGLAWSVVDGFNLGRNDSTRFEASSGDTADATTQRAELQIGAFSSTTARFNFEVPSFTPEGAQFCQSLYIGLDPSPLYNLLEQRQLFCIEKRGNVFRSFQGIEMSKAGIEGDQRSIEQRMLSQGMESENP